MGTPEEYDLEFRALEYSLFTCCFFQALGAFFFFVMSWYVMSDKSKAERQIACNADILGPENQPTPDRYREDVDFREGTPAYIQASCRYLGWGGVRRNGTS